MDIATSAVMIVFAVSAIGMVMALKKRHMKKRNDKVMRKMHNVDTLPVKYTVRTVKQIQQHECIEQAKPKQYNSKEYDGFPYSKPRGRNG
jgi:hypothetical protein